MGLSKETLLTSDSLFTRKSLLSLFNKEHGFHTLLILENKQMVIRAGGKWGDGG